MKERRFVANERSESKRSANLLRAWGPAAAWATVLFLLSAWSSPEIPSWLAVNDKVAHAGLYSVLGLSLGYGRHYDWSPPHHLVLLSLGAIYGATDEWHQAFTYGRTPGWGDWIADVVGVSFGYLFALFLLSRVAPRAMTPHRASSDVAD